MRGHAAGIGKVDRQYNANAVETGNAIMTRRRGACTFEMSVSVENRRRRRNSGLRTDGKDDIRRITGRCGAGGVHSSESNDDLRDDAERGRMYSESMLERGDEMGESNSVSPCLAEDGRSARTRSNVLETSTGNMLDTSGCCSTS